MNLFFLVLSRDTQYLSEKIKEIDSLGVPYLIVCGEKFDSPKVVYRKPKGKYDALNFGLKLIPENVDIVIFNDVDTRIYNFEEVLNLVRSVNVPDLLFVRVYVDKGPQTMFYSFLDGIRRRFSVAASGELMLIKYSFLKRILPLKSCKAEDSYILFKVLELGGRVAFCEKCFVTTKRTVTVEQEEVYKRRTVCGIYQALSMCKPPFMVRLFYTLLPFASPLLLLSGRKGYYWMKGILHGFVDFIKGDRSGYWESIEKNVCSL